MSHVVLLGDSIFDNAAYVSGGPDVIAQIRAKLGSASRATLLAVDGSVTTDVKNQLRKLPPDATHLVVSAGGNDALGHTDILDARSKTTAETLERLAEIGADFERRYAEMLNTILAVKKPTAICTIYYPRFPDRTLQRLSVTALTVFNDVILRLGFAAGIPILDLRLICSEDADYANAIEPSSHGGQKIAHAIVGLVNRHDFTRRRAEIYIDGV
ncbi:MAG TPA: SGNH/GDSL hydrolase family protein [Gemmatimonadaceae bacterium]